MFELTEQQRRAIQSGEAVRLPAPEIGDDVVVLRAAAYEAIQGHLEAEREKQAIARVALKSAAKWAQENPF
jgi:hypothetical protein